MLYYKYKEKRHKTLEGESTMLKYNVRGENVEVTDALRDYVQKRLNKLEAHQSRQGAGHNVPRRLPAVLSGGVQQSHRREHDPAQHQEAQVGPQLNKGLRHHEEPARKLQRRPAHRGQGQGQGDGHQQKYGVQQHLGHVNDLIFRTGQVVGPAHGDHQAVRRPHGKVDGKHQPEPQHCPAGGLADIAEVALDQLHHPGRQQGRESLNDAGDIQLQQTQQAAEENQEGTDHKEQVVGQGRSLLGYAVKEVALHCPGQESPGPAV